MNIRKNMRFKLVEIENAFVIMGEHDNLGKRPIMAELIIADMPTMAEYLNRYIENRGAGLRAVESHQRALYGANIIAPGTMDMPEDFGAPQ